MGPLLSFRLPDDQNAFTLYRQASEKAKRNEVIERRILNGPYTWPNSDPEALAYLATNRESLGLWRQGNERPDALYVPIGEMTFETRLPLLIDHRHFARMALVEAARLRDEGDMAGAWDWYCSILRGSRLLGRNGTVISALVGIAEYATAGTAIASWQADPRVEPALLRRALDDVRAVDVLTGPNAVPSQVEYLSVMRMLEDPDHMMRFFLDDSSDGDKVVDRTAWYNHAPAIHRVAFFLENEPERTRRLVNLAFANWLAQCEKPPGLRPPMIGTKEQPRWLYDTPARPGGLSSATLLRHFQSSRFAQYLIPASGAIARAFDRDRSQRAGLVVALASELYRRERGKEPGSPADLVGPYLKELPDGVSADSAGLPPKAQ